MHEANALRGPCHWSSRALIATATVAVLLTACGRSDGSTSQSAAPRGPIAVGVTTGIPRHGQLGLAIMRFKLPRALGTADMGAVRLRWRAGVTAPRDLIAVAIPALSRDGQTLSVVTIEARHHAARQRGRNSVQANGVATLPGETQLLHSTPAGTAGSPYSWPNPAVPAGQQPPPPCAELRSLLKRSGRPAAVAGARNITAPVGPLTDGTPQVQSRTRAGIFLDQAIGTFCQPGLRTRWLVSMLAH